MNAVERVRPVVIGAPLVEASPGFRAVRALLCATSCAVLVGVLAGLAWVHMFTTSMRAPAPARPPDTLAVFSDLRSVPVTVTTPAWTKIREVVTVDRLRADRTLWKLMHFGDWDDIPPDIRTPALQAMVRTYRDVFSGPRTWRRMSAADWDHVPQPIRSMAFLRMIWYWTAAEDVGSEFGLAPEQVAQTIGAIVMTESWFEHRAINVNPWGNRDLGLAQCSDHCRETLAAMAAACEIMFTPSEEDYFNPWIATRIATVWFERELHRAHGDVDLATRAYHRGLDQALDEKGDAYFTRVARLRDQYIRATGASDTWRFLTQEIGRL